MPKFQIEFCRRVIDYEYVTREIEADSLEAATLAADVMASEFNGDCPDDTKTQVGESGSWDANTITAIKAKEA